MKWKALKSKEPVASETGQYSYTCPEVLDFWKHLWIMTARSGNRWIVVDQGMSFGVLGHLVGPRPMATFHVHESVVVEEAATNLTAMHHRQNASYFPFQHSAKPHVRRAIWQTSPHHRTGVPYPRAWAWEWECGGCSCHKVHPCGIPVPVHIVVDCNVPGGGRRGER